MSDEASSNAALAQRTSRLCTTIARRIDVLDSITKVHLQSPSPPATADQSSSNNNSGRGSLGDDAADLGPLERPNGVLWMGTGFITGQDIDRHFGSAAVAEALAASNAPSPDSPALLAAAAATTNPSACGLLDGADALTPVTPKWLGENVVKWYQMGFGVAALLVTDVGATGASIEFCTSVHELLLEIDHAASAGTLLWRAQCERALRKDRERRGVVGQRLPTSTGYTLNTAPSLPFLPSYQRTVASASHTLALAYRRLMDPDLCRDEATFKRFQNVDTVIQSQFIVPIVKELHAIVRAKIEQAEIPRLRVRMGFDPPSSLGATLRESAAGLFASAKQALASARRGSEKSSASAAPDTADPSPSAAARPSPGASHADPNAPSGMSALVLSDLSSGTAGVTPPLTPASGSEK